MRAGQPNLTAADVGGPGNGPGNYEHMDYVAIERQIALDRLPNPAHPGHGRHRARTANRRIQTSRRSGSTGSSDPVHVVLDGGHVIHEDDPEGVAAQVVKVMERVRSG